jgi:AAA domain
VVVQFPPKKARDEPPPNMGESARQGEQRPPKFPLIAWPEITFEPEEEWRVEGMFPRVGLACLYGGPGAVKTFILLDLFNRMASGGLWGGRDVEQSPVIYIAAEGANGIKKRIAAIKKRQAEKGLPADVPFYLITVAPNLGTGEGDLKELVANIEAVGVWPGAIAIDTTAQSIGGADENTTGMGQLVANATALVNHFSCLVVLVHHVPLSDEERLRGGTALIGALDVSILSKREKGSLTATLSIKKMKDDDEGQSFTVHLVRIVLGETKSGREISTLVVESVEPGAAEGGSDTGKKLAPCAFNALSALRYALDEVGAAPPASNHIPGGQKCVSLDQWRTYAFLRSDLELKDSKKKELSRGIAILRARKLIGIWEAYA